MLVAGPLCPGRAVPGFFQNSSRRPCFIQHGLSRHLTDTSRMDYFAFSPFWDSKSNNNVLRTQRRVENPGYGHAEEKVYVYGHQFSKDTR